MDPEIEFRDARVDAGHGRALTSAMKEEIAALYDGLELDGAKMPAAGHEQLSPPGGVFIVGFSADEPVCCGGVKRLGGGACEIKRMYVVPEARGRGVARALLHALEDRARTLGYSVARLDTGPSQPHARSLYESEGYIEIENFNANPVATYFGEKRLGQ